MKTRTIVWCCLGALLVLVFGHGSGSAKADKGAFAKVGVVSVRKIFEDCKKNVGYKQRMEEEQKRIIAELEQLRAQIEVERSGLRTLKAGSTEHSEQMRAALLKQANYTAQEEYYKQQMALKEQQWIEQIYRDIVRITGEVAKERELDLVLECSKPQLDEATAESLVMSIRTNKLLYSDGCVDITDEVMSRLDAEK